MASVPESEGVAFGSESIKVFMAVATALVVHTPQVCEYAVPLIVTVKVSVVEASKTTLCVPLATISPLPSLRYSNTARPATVTELLKLFEGK